MISLQLAVNVIFQYFTHTTQYIIHLFSPSLLCLMYLSHFMVTDNGSGEPLLSRWPHSGGRPAAVDPHRRGNPYWGNPHPGDAAYIGQHTHTPARPGYPLTAAAAGGSCCEWAAGRRRDTAAGSQQAVWVLDPVTACYTVCHRKHC